jgi:carbamoyltransferase|tara:strand:+ start:2682 stop:4403 length:1722 start_codon:yes stop_codon:yes gene_type:complete
LSHKKITVLGIHFYHDAGAAIIQNGKILSAVSEEKLTNIKNWSGYPIKSIEHVLKSSKIDPNEIDAIAIAGVAQTKFPKPYLMHPNYRNAILYWNWLRKYPNGLKLNFINLQKHLKVDGMKKIFTELKIPINKIIFVEHHMAHAASAYYLSPWNFDDDVLIFTADGEGDSLSSSVSIGHAGHIQRIENSETSFFNSLSGSFYAAISGYLGLDWGNHAGKVMGLAPYGNAERSIEKIKKMLDFDENPLQFKNKIEVYGNSIQKKYREILSGQRFHDVAAATQKWFEELITKWISTAIEDSNIQKIACAGGNFQNVKANKEIINLENVNEAFFCPAAGDDGLAVGVALAGYHEICSLDGIKPNKYPLKDVYFGPEYSNEEILKSIKKYDLVKNTEFIDEIDHKVGELLVNSNNIIARFSDKMEWGPRALGNRSILANPSNPLIVRKINKAIKMRDFWMPFGASILQSRMNDYLENATISPYMILAFDTTKLRDELISAIHPSDYTCRPQIILPEHNKNYEKVVKTFESKTGIGAVLNTSFNLHGSPTVCDPQTALETFKNSELDYLAIGNYLIKK